MRAAVFGQPSGMSPRVFNILERNRAERSSRPVPNPKSGNIPSVRPYLRARTIYSIQPGASLLGDDGLEKQEESWRVQKGHVEPKQAAKSSLGGRSR